MTRLIFILAALMFGRAEAKQVRIAVIDSGLSVGQEAMACPNQIRDFTGYGVADVMGHGSNINAIIYDNTKKKDRCLIIIKYYHDKTVLPAVSVVNSNKAWRYAIDQHPDIINYSSYGNVENVVEKAQVLEALRKGITVVVPSGNDHKDLDYSCGVYPSCYGAGLKHPNLFVVGRSDIISTFEHGYGFGSIVTDYKNGCPGLFGGFTRCGTSQATALKTAELVNK